MDELIEKVAERAGIDESQAQQAIAAVLEHLRGQLPGPLASQLESLVGGGGNGDGGGLSDVLKGLGGLGR